jgi:hypothetical protein
MNLCDIVSETSPFCPPNEVCKETAVTPPIRVALFADCFGEANSVATRSREFTAFTERRVGARHGITRFCAGDLDSSTAYRTYEVGPEQIGAVTNDCVMS